MSDQLHPFWSNLFRKPAHQNQIIADLWSQTPLFQDISAKHCMAMVPDMHVRNYEPGEFIFKKGEQGLGVAMVLSGSVAVRSDNKLLATLVKGDFFGEVALVADEYRTADAIAAESAEVVFFLRPHLFEWLDKSPKTGVIIMTNLARILGRRLSQANEFLGLKHD